MASEWRKSEWGDIATIEYGKSLRGYQNAKGRYRVYGTNGPIGWHDEPLCTHPSIIIGRKGAIQRQQLLEAWYRIQLKAAIPDLIEKWEPIVGRSVKGCTVRRMKTKWGSCNPHSRRLSVNLELAKKHPRCLEYIVVHEMTHLHERTHNEHFMALLDEYLPNWRALRDELNRAPLAHEEWLS